MNSDTRWVVGTGVAIVTAIVGTGAVLAGLLLTQMGALHARFDGLDDRLRAVEIGFGRVQQRLLAIEQHVESIEQRVESIEQRVESIEQRVESIEQRVESIEQRVESIEQRLLTIERVVLPARTAPGE